MNPTVTLPDELELGGGGQLSWRITNGAINRGREIDGTLESKDMMFGWLRRVGVHHGEYDDGNWADKLEIDIETKGGVETVSVSLGSSRSDGKPSYAAALGFALGLLGIQKDALMAVKPNQSKKLNKYGKYTTYVNVYTVDPMTMASKPVDYEIDWDNLQDQYAKTIEAVKGHPAYAPRPERKTDTDGHPDLTTPKDEFFSTAVAAGWPAPTGIEAEYCATFAKALKKDVKSFTDLDDADWKTLEEGVALAKAVPKALRDAKPANDEPFDPFA